MTCHNYAIWYLYNIHISSKLNKDIKAVSSLVRNIGRRNKFKNWTHYFNFVCIVLKCDNRGAGTYIDRWFFFIFFMLSYVLSYYIVELSGILFSSLVPVYGCRGFSLAVVINITRNVEFIKRLLKVSRSISMSLQILYCWHQLP